MAAQALVYRWEGQLTKVIPVGLVPEGIRLDVGFTATVVEGTLSGHALEGVDYLLLRSDGVAVIDAYEQLELAPGQAIALHARGYVTPPEGVVLPPPNILLSPDFRWPDLQMPMHGAVSCQTGVAEWAWLNRTMLGFYGWVNLGTQRLGVTAHMPTTA